MDTMNLIFETKSFQEEFIKGSENNTVQPTSQGQEVIH
jgi:hypothetical protein